MAQAIRRGENAIVRFNLTFPDEVTPLPLTDVQSLSVQLIDSKDNVLKTYQFPSAQLRQSDTAQVELEIVSADTKKLPVGQIGGVVLLGVKDTEYTVDDAQNDIIDIGPLLVVS